jgi:mono/diheme cytochrome c family protein/rhodanese-related sulfurtransferase
LVLALTACGESESAVTVSLPARGEVDPRVAEGQTKYLRYCALCHGREAEGYAADHANAIGHPSFLRIATDEFLRASIKDGRPGTPMSAWGRQHGGPLGDEDIDAIIAYLRSLSSKPAIDVSSIRVNGAAERGAPIYAQNCSSCHGERGEGTDTATSISHPNFHRDANDGFIRHTIEYGRQGTPMRSFRDLPAQALDDLVAFVRTLEHEPERPTAPGGAPPPELANLVINPGGEPPTFTLREERYVPALAVKEALEQGRRMVILDARATSDWANAHIPGAAPFPFYDIAQMAESLPHDGTWILAYCACPHAASGHVVDELRSRGFEHTAVIDEGIHHWIDQGYPVAQGSAPRTP